MNYKSSQVRPPCIVDTKLKVSVRWPADSPLRYSGAEFFRSWLIYDPELDEHRRINRHVILGMALVIGVSASFWAGVGFAIAQIWK
jgi:hypothetical protein